MKYQQVQVLRLLGVSNDLRLGSPVVKHAGKDETNNCVNEVPKMSFLPHWLFFSHFFFESCLPTWQVLVLSNFWDGDFHVTRNQRLINK